MPVSHRQRCAILGFVILSSGYELNAQTDTPEKESPAPALMSFCVMGDVPYEAYEDELLPLQIAGLPDDIPFSIHVGDIKRGRAPCDEAVYRKVAELLRQADAPVFHHSRRQRIQRLPRSGNGLEALDYVVRPVRPAVGSTTSRSPARRVVTRISCSSETASCLSASTWLAAGSTILKSGGPGSMTRRTGFASAFTKRKDDRGRSNLRARHADTQASRIFSEPGSHSGRIQKADGLHPRRRSRFLPRSTLSRCSQFFPYPGRPGRNRSADSGFRPPESKATVRRRSAARSTAGGLPAQ